jgi:hypothetical protein
MARPRLPRTTRIVTVGALVTIVTAGCMTGERPSFDEDQPASTATGDAAIDAVLDRLDRVPLEQFTAQYSVLTRLGGLETQATVVQADNSRRSVTIGDVRFLDGTGTVATCNLTSGECEATLNNARVSDRQMTYDFYAASAAQRLRVDADRRIGDARGHDETIAGQPAVCADVPVSGGTKVYCALDTGALATYDGADLAIDLTSYVPTPDENAFTTG